MEIEIFITIIISIVSFFFWSFFAGRKEFKSFLIDINSEIREIEFGLNGQIGTNIYPLFQKGTKSVKKRLKILNELKNKYSFFSLFELYYSIKLGVCLSFGCDNCDIGVVNHKLGTFRLS